MFLCNGDSDEHLRLSVLIASALGTPATAEAVETACSPRSSWEARSRALEEVLARAEPPSKGSPLGVLVDLDALFESAGSIDLVWDDATFRSERREFIEIVLHAVAAGGWLLVRPDPCVALSLRLEDVGTHDHEEDHAAEVTASEPPAFSAVVREIVSSLVRLELLDHVGMERWEHQDKPVGEIIELALEQFSPHTLAAGARLSHERMPLERNGRCGPFSWNLPQSEPLGMDRDAFDTLTQRGFLLATEIGDQAPRWMPRAVRRAFSARRQEPAEPVHGGLSWCRDLHVPSQSIEAHWHAIMAGDAERALATARYYLNDLREIAKRHSASRRWHDAAEIYARILEHDDSDAYAWEYWGYNLARLDDDADAPRRTEAIERAYARAHALAPSNPLYHGRMLGFALRRHTATIEDAHRVCAYYRHLYGQTAVEWFGWQVAQALRRRGDKALAAAFSTRWRIEGPIPAQKLPRRFGAGPRGIELTADFDDPMPEFDHEGDPLQGRD